MTHTITKIIEAIISHKLQKNCKLQEISQVHFEMVLAYKLYEDHKMPKTTHCCFDEKIDINAQTIILKFHTKWKTTYNQLYILLIIEYIVSHSCK